MMGIPLMEASYVDGDSMSVVTNSSKPESTLKKKSNSICYHAVGEAVATGKALAAHIPTKKNLADLFTKELYGQAWRFLVTQMLWDVFPEMMCLCSRGGGSRVRVMTGPGRFGLKHIEQVGVITPYFVACMYFTKIALVRPGQAWGD
jgi:hypothetical protein